MRMTLLEVSGDELRAVVRDNPGMLAKGYLLASLLEDRLHLGLRSWSGGPPQWMTQLTEAVEDGCTGRRKSPQMLRSFREIDVPVLMGRRGLLEALHPSWTACRSRGSQLAGLP